MKLVYNVKDKPKFPQLLVFALQQLLAIMTATLVVPIITGHGMSPAAALFGAGIGTIVYVLFTKAKSPVFLGSSFAFLGSMASAFAGGVSMELGYLGLIIGATFAGLVYVVIAIIVKCAGVNWLNKLMPTAVIGSTVTVIGLSLAGNAVSDMVKGNVTKDGVMVGSPLIALVCALVTLFVVVLCSVYGKKMMKLIPFVIGIGAGYVTAAIFTVIGNVADVDALKILNFSVFESLLVDGKVAFSTFFSVPDFTFLTAFKGTGELTGAYIAKIAVAYIPVAFVVFAEHIADHKNISTIIEKDLLEDPGLHRTLLGDGVGSIAGAIFGGCPNTTYGESVGCVAITGNASVVTIIAAAIGAMLIAFISPFVALVNSIPSCVMGGVCLALYGFIAVSGLKMVQKVDLEDNRNLFVVSTILVAGIGGLVVNFGHIQITNVATALILGIIVNIMVNKKSGKKAK
ncbi:MAG: uracil-xanthine permease [Clostridia bacterium]|nr:uracil-xanthine permease [Clostridia bacterium]MDY3784338.1 solute carrier family 23 protein [Eubacteriales bacterium]